MQAATREVKKHGTEEQRWQAVLERDSRSDGAFVYAVRSTGIYCRPSCPSKRPHRQHVLFFPLPEVAEREGFRACRRCRPDGVAAADPRLDLVRRACRIIEANPEGSLTLDNLGSEIGLSPHHLQRTFKRIMGITPRQYAEACRLGRLKAQLKEGETVTRALYGAGYGSSSRLYERAPAQMGMTPSTYRRGGLGMSIAYSVTPSPLGLLMVAATDKGICGISLGDSRDSLEAGLRKEYPAAEITLDDGTLGAWVTEILRHLEGEQPNLDLPIDVQATAFQWQVWEMLRAIPYGSTRSYGEIARAIGRPTATRAVAQACGSNRTALLIPCHRVVRENGELGGYRWGIERKRKLLEQERTRVEHPTEQQNVLKT